MKTGKMTGEEFSLLRQYFRIKKDIFHFTAICSCIHGNCSTYGARDSCRKLKTGESGIPCSSGCSAKQSTRLHFNYCILHRNCLEVLTYLDNHSSKTFVRYQQVTSITHNKKRNPRFFCTINRTSDFFPCCRLNKNICRASNGKTCVLIHRFLLCYCSCFNLLSQILKEFLIHNISYISPI